MGYTGQISLGQGAFMAVGAYASGLMVMRLGIPWGPSIILASLLTAAVGVFFGLPSLRLKGLYLAIATLAAQEIVEWVVTHWTAVTGGTEALVVPSPMLMGIRLNRDFHEGPVREDSKGGDATPLCLLETPTSQGLNQFVRRAFVRKVRL